MMLIKRWLIVVGLWIAGLGGWRPCAKIHLAGDDLLQLARKVCEEVEMRFPQYSGELKRREAQRMLLNILPTALAREVNFLIELALQPGEPEPAGTGA